MLVPIPALDNTTRLRVFTEVAFTFVPKIFNVWTAFEANTLPTTWRDAPGVAVPTPTKPPAVP